MSLNVESEQATIAEAMEVLMEHLPPSKVVRLLSAWQVGKGDYLVTRERLLADETVDSLFEKARALDGGVKISR